MTLAAPVITVIIGWLAEVPWFWVWLSALASFAFVSSSLLTFSQWIDRQRVADKLTFSTVRFVQDIRGGGGVALGILLSSSADIPVEFEMTKITTQIGDRVPSKKTFDVKQITIPRRGSAFFDDHPISLPTVNGGAVEGVLEFELRYGRVGARNHVLGIKKRVHLRFDRDGKLENCSWQDTPS